MSIGHCLISQLQVGNKMTKLTYFKPVFHSCTAFSGGLEMEPSPKIRQFTEFFESPFSGVVLVFCNFEQNSHIVLVFPLLAFGWWYINDLHWVALTPYLVYLWFNFYMIYQSTILNKMGEIFLILCFFFKSDFLGVQLHVSLLVCVVKSPGISWTEAWIHLNLLF